MTAVSPMCDFRLAVLVANRCDAEASFDEESQRYLCEHHRLFVHLARIERAKRELGHDK